MLDWSISMAFFSVWGFYQSNLAIVIVVENDLNDPVWFQDEGVCVGTIDVGVCDEVVGRTKNRV